MKSTLVAVALLGTCLPAAAEPGPTPEKITVCAACHGADGKSTQPTYPNLAGQYANYLANALQEYRAGSRKNPIMAGQAASLTDVDIRQLAEYFASQPGPLYTPGIRGHQK